MRVSGILEFTTLDDEILGPFDGLFRRFRRLLAAQNAIHIGGGATIEVYPDGSVGEQAAVSVGRAQCGHLDVECMRKLATEVVGLRPDCPFRR